MQKFLRSCEGRRETALRDLRRRMARTLEVLQASPRCRDGRSLMGVYGAQHFEACQMGGVWGGSASFWM